MQLALDAEFFNPFAQRRPRDTKQFRGVKLVVVCLLERLNDQFAFNGWNDF